MFLDSEMSSTEVESTTIPCMKSSQKYHMKSVYTVHGIDVGKYLIGWRGRATTPCMGVPFVLHRWYGQFHFQNDSAKGNQWRLHRGKKRDLISVCIQRAVYMHVCVCVCVHVWTYLLVTLNFPVGSQNQAQADISVQKQ